MPWAALVCGILVALTGVWLAVAGRSWKSSRRYAPAPAAAAESANAQGGSRTAGQETTAGEGTTASSAAAAGNAADSDAGPEPVDEIDSWDRLTRGDDPTNYR